jgi:hypothetical protein
MNMKKNKKFFISMAALAVLAVVFRFFDEKIAAILYKSGNPLGGLSEISGSAIPFLICAFCFSTMIFCRHTKTTRTKNQVLSVLYGILALISSAAAFYFPMHNSSKKNYYIVVFGAAILTAIFIYLGATLFKSTYQKMLMTKCAKIGIISSLASLIVYLAAKILPQRPSYEALQISMEKFGNYDTPEAFVPFLALSGVGAAMMMWITCFSDIFPKLKFSKKYLFVFSVIWAAAMLFGSISSGRTYGFEFILTLIVSYLILYFTRLIIEKREGEN